MKKRWLALGLVLAMTAMVFAGCGRDAAEEQGVIDGEETAVRDYDDIDFDTVTILEEEVPLGSSVNNANAEELAQLQTVAHATLDLVNQQRANAGLAALTWDTDLELAAAVRAAETVQLFSHTRPDGTPWYTVNPQIMHGENLAYGNNSAESVVNAWMNSPAHRENILWPTFTKCAIGIYKNGNTYYIAQAFRY